MISNTYYAFCVNKFVSVHVYINKKALKNENE
ncbi:hypothetical protein IMSAGC004_01998 [Bacteroidaceae bacterium]|nr:hypothetical protein IMSAGC004_01998 [Bacteroidaceae bacterium]